MSGWQPTEQQWYRLSAGALVALLIVFAAWVSWELKFIHDRRAWYAETQMIYSPYSSGPHPGPGIPFWRRWLGDERYSIIQFPASGDTPEEREKARALYPEATIH